MRRLLVEGNSIVGLTLDALGLTPLIIQRIRGLIKGEILKIDLEI